MDEIVKEKIEAYFRQLFLIVDESEKFIRKDTTILREIFQEEFFSRIRKRLNIYKGGDRGAKIHSFYNLLLRHDFGNNFSKLKLLDD